MLQEVAVGVGAAATVITTGVHGYVVVTGAADSGLL